MIVAESVCLVAWSVSPPVEEDVKYFGLFKLFIPMWMWHVSEVWLDLPVHGGLVDFGHVDQKPGAF